MSVIGLDALGGICGTSLAAGSACAVEKQCASGRCEDKICRDKLKDGESCNEEADCTNGCVAFVGLNFVGGVCGKNLADGTSCADTDSQCKSGHCAKVSGGSGASFLGQRWECKARQVDGTSCDRSAVCAANICTESLFYGVCGSSKPKGALCLADGVCETGRCDFNGAQRVCQGVAPPGGSCNEDTDCGSGTGTALSTKKCYAYVGGGNNFLSSLTVGLGGICGDNLKQGSRCATGAQCVSKRCAKDSHTCEDKLKDGDSCDTNDDCLASVCKAKSGLSVGGTTLFGGGICGNNLADYSACADNDQCKSGRCHTEDLLGRDRKCKPKMPFGSECRADEDCRNGMCVEGLLGSGRCGKKTTGTSCFADDACQSKRCEYEGFNRVCKGRLPDGERCTEHSDCTDFKCWPVMGLAIGDQTLFGGICGSNALEGQPCAANDQCATGRCAEDSKTGSTTCQAKLPKGASCDASNDCADAPCVEPLFHGICGDKPDNKVCALDNSCASGRCEFEGFTRKCLPKTSDEGACNEDGDCSSGKCVESLFFGKCGAKPNGDNCLGDGACKSGRCAIKRIKSTCQATLPQGGKCRADSDCSGGQCFEPLWFGRCGLKTLNDKCVSSSACQSNRCDGGKCVGKLADSAPCNEHSDCSTGHCYSSGIKGLHIFGGRCGKGPLALDQLCAASGQCGSGLCQDKCVPKLADFAKCWRDDACASGSCVEPLFDGRCTKKATGTKCLTDSVCSSGRCEDFKCAEKSKAGGSCNSDDDCADGSCSEPLFKGVCGLKKLGAPCIGSSACASTRCDALECKAVLSAGRSCNENNDCADNDCVAYHGLEVGGRSFGGICGTNADLPDAAECAAGTQCRSGRCHKYKCAPRLSDGESCKANEDCESLDCVDKLWNPMCGKKGNGVTCASNGACQSGRCELTSGLVATCVGTLAAGSNCNEDSDCNSKKCFAFAGLKIGAAAPFKGVCGTDLPLGTVCAADEQCAGSKGCKYVSGFTSRCGGQAPDGKGCNEDKDCTSGACTKYFGLSIAGVGFGGICGNNRPEGASCASEAQCASGRCEHYSGLEWRCTSKLGDGAKCNEATDCAANVCKASVQVLGVGNGRCGMNLKDGTSCAVSAQCSSARCKHTTGLDFECAPKLADGAECKNSDDCQTFCTEGGLLTGRCGLKDIGVGCLADAACGTGRCDLGKSGRTCMGLVKDGGNCNSNSDCAAGECQAYLGGATVFGGICGIKLPAESRCSKDSQCASGRCERTTGVTFQCKERLPQFAACNEDSDCANNDCHEPLFEGRCGLKKNKVRCLLDKACLSGRCDGWVCVGKAKDGASCAENDDCASGDCKAKVKIGGLVVGTGVCGMDLPNGMLCAVPDQCQSGRCGKGGDAGLFDASKCLPRAEEGDKCDNDGDCMVGVDCTESLFNGNGLDIGRCGKKFDGVDCIANSACRSNRCTQRLLAIVGKCEAAAGQGEKCNEDVDCGGGNCVEPLWFGICGTKPNDVPCILDSSCESGRCQAGTCRGALPAGSYCESNSDCAADDCFAFKGVSIFGNTIRGVCGSTLPDGSKCAQDKQCGSSRCKHTSGLTWTCVKQGVVGDKCHRDTDCGSPTGGCSEPLWHGRCGKKANDIPCVSDGACSSGRCSLSSGSCKPRLPNGSTCGSSSDCEVAEECHARFDVALFGHTILGVCGDELAEKTRCVQDEQCASGRCDLYEGKRRQCTKRLPELSPCNEDSDCLEGKCVESLVDGHCGAKPNGAKCVANDACESKRCDGFQCTGQLPAGSGCNEDSDCSGKCYSYASVKIKGFALFSGICGKDLPSGAMCASSEQCAASATTGKKGECKHVVGFNSRCGGVAADGEACNENQDCMGGACTTYLGVGIGGICGKNMADGAACAGNKQCKSGRCEHEGGLNLKFKCRSTLADGAKCQEDSDCDAGTCAEPAYFGRCGLKPEKTPCVSSSACASGRCDLGTCKGKAPRGQPCNSQDDCEGGKKCWLRVGGIGLFGGICDGNLENAAKCADDRQCTSGRCARQGLGHVCKPKAGKHEDCGSDSDCTANNCVEPGWFGKCEGKQLGHLCVKSASCPAGTRCDLGTCKAKLADGVGGCNEDADCVTAHCWAHLGKATFLGGVCGKDLSVDSECAADEQCTSGRCAGGKCQAKVAAGGKCSDDNDCAVSPCVSYGGLKLVGQTLLGGICGNGLTDGTKCAQDKQCSSARCSGFTCAAKEAVGGKCGNDGDCQNNNCVEGWYLLSGRCGPKANGIACAASSACTSQRCDLGKCVARLADGKGCNEDTDCSSKDGCKAYGGLEIFGVSFAGVCGSNLVVGATCAGNDQCASGRCQTFKCAAKIADGSDCDGDDVDCVSGVCTKFQGIGIGLKGLFMGGVCGKGPFATGARCAKDNQCTTGLCKDNKCAAKQAAQGACGRNTECATGKCVEDLWHGRCDNKPIGTKCLVDSSCETGARCEAVGLLDLECIAKAKAGESCNESDDCVDGVSCTEKLFFGKCGPKADGAVCASNGACASGRCSLGKCKAKSTDGDSCVTNADCATGDCQFKLLNLKGVCGQNLKTGTACVNSAQCLSDRCQDFKCAEKKQDGGECDSADDCAASSCTEPLLSGRCGKKAIGVLCVTNGACATGSCDGFPSKCTGTNPDGDLCNENADCATGDCVAWAGLELAGRSFGGVCGNELKEGLKCVKDGQCTSKRCDHQGGLNWVCKAKVADQVACRADDDCLSGTCTAAAVLDIFGGICGKGPFASGKCAKDAQCSSGLCKDGACKAKSAAQGACGRNTECVTGKCVEDLWHGRCDNKPIGTKCLADSSCEAGARCEAAGLLDLECIAKAKAGESCNESDDCVDGVSCTEKLFFGKCGPKVDGAVCASNGACASGRCSFGKCKAKLAPRASCLVNSDCVSDVCVGINLGAGIIDGKCSQLDGSGVIALGANCATNNQCESRRCEWEGIKRVCYKQSNANEGCDEDSDCAAGDCVEPLHKGNCGKKPDGYLCISNSACVNNRCDSDGGFLTKKCMSPSADGQQCNEDSDCANKKCVGALLGISALGGVCGDKIPNGYGCLKSDQCESRRCDFGKCKARLSDGSSCGDASDCTSNKCTGVNLGITTLGGVCGSTIPNGMSCLTGDQCSSGRCETVWLSLQCQARLGGGSSCNEDSDCNTNRCDCGSWYSRKCC